MWGLHAAVSQASLESLVTSGKTNFRSAFLIRRVGTYGFGPVWVWRALWYNPPPPDATGRVFQLHWEGDLRTCGEAVCDLPTPQETCWIL